MPVVTFNSRVEAALAQKQAMEAVEGLRTRAGDFARRLDHLLRLDPNAADAVADAFGEVAEKVSTPVLLQVRQHFKERDRTAPLRVFVPKGLDASKPVPVVFALHGAGGSENLFFEGYGAGRIVKECEQRGWVLVATRSGLGFGTAPPLADVLEQLGTRYPLDAKRVFVVNGVVVDVAN